MRSPAIEAAWHCAPAPVCSKRLTERGVGTDQKIIVVADKAIHWLHKRYTRLAMRRKPGNVAITAAACELCGFVWNVMRDEAV
jgi:hypothetical protein